jgi:transposase
MPPKWQPPDAQDLIDAYLEGQSAYELAARYGVHEATVRKALADLGVRRRNVAEVGQLRRGRPVMSRRRDLPVADLITLYRSGVSVPELAERYGVATGTVAHRLHEAGLTLHGPSKQLDAEMLARRYASGESTDQIAADLGVSGSAVARTLRRSGYEFRPMDERTRLAWRSMTPERRRLASENRRRGQLGRKMSAASLHQRALAREGRFLPANNSPAEATLRQWLDDAGINPVINKAIGPYNADLGAHPVAVEVFGGNHHGSGAHARSFPKRCRYILDSGWSLVIVWVCRFFPLTMASIDYLVPFIETARRDETGGGQYRVIGGNGQPLASRDGDFDDFTFVPPGS